MLRRKTQGWDRGFLDVTPIISQRSSTHIAFDQGRAVHRGASAADDPCRIGVELMRWTNESVLVECLWYARVSR
jgi:hypothetical protein